MFARRTRSKSDGGNRKCFLPLQNQVIISLYVVNSKSSAIVRPMGFSSSPRQLGPTVSVPDDPSSLEFELSDCRVVELESSTCCGGAVKVTTSTGPISGVGLETPEQEVATKRSSKNDV